MNRIAIIIILGSLCLLSGCIEVSYKSEVTAKLKSPFAPAIIDDGYPNSTQTKSALKSSDKNRHTMSPIIKEPKRKGFKKFKKREI